MRTLNIGCGSDITGYTDYVDIAPINNHVIKCNISKDKLPYNTGTFDLVYCRNVIEVIDNPSNFFKEVYRVLKRGGKLELYVSNASGIDTLLGNNAGYKNNNMISYQLAYMIYTIPILQNWLMSNGFDATETKYITTKPTEKRLDLLFHYYLIKIAGILFNKFNSQIYAQGYKL